MRARYVVAGLAGGAWVAATHWLMTSAPQSDWNGVAVVGPMLVLFAFFAWRQRQRALAAAGAIAALALVVQAWRGRGVSPAALYVTQHVAIHLALACAFGASLLPRRQALITMLARRVHKQVTPALAAYTRRLTAAWTIYFVAMALLSIALYAFAPFDAWAGFANLATPLAMAAMFVGEYLLRYRLHPEFERTTLADAAQAYSQRRAVAEAAPLESDKAA